MVLGAGRWRTPRSARRDHRPPARAGRPGARGRGAVAAHRLRRTRARPPAAPARRSATRRPSASPPSSWTSSRPDPRGARRAGRGRGRRRRAVGRQPPAGRRRDRDRRRRARCRARAGAGSAALVTARLVQDARERGADVVFIEAGDADIARIYGRLGFERVGTPASRPGPRATRPRRLSAVPGGRGSSSGPGSPPSRARSRSPSRRSSSSSPTSRPSTAAIFRCAYALPVLGAARLARGPPLRPAAAARPAARRRGRRVLRGRPDLLAPRDRGRRRRPGDRARQPPGGVVPFAAWAVLGERIERRLLVALPLVCSGVVLISGVLETAPTASTRCAACCSASSPA